MSNKKTRRIPSKLNLRKESVRTFPSVKLENACTYTTTNGQMGTCSCTRVMPRNGDDA